MEEMAAYDSRVVMEEKIKIVGKRVRPRTPAECHAAGARLYKAAVAMNPWPRPRGFVFKAQTWADYESWRAAQDNPWLW